MLLILDERGRITNPEQVDEYVCARIPALPALNDLSTEANQQRRLWHYVTSMMIHDCNAACEKQELSDSVLRTTCRKHFPKPYSDFTELSGFYHLCVLILFFIEVRYTNYVRIPPEEASEELRASAHNNEPTMIAFEDLLLDEDPERDWNEVRYQRLPQQGRHPQRIYVSLLYFFMVTVDAR